MTSFKKYIYLLLNIIILIGTVSAQNSPSGLVIGQNLPDYDKTWYFCPNGNLQATEDVYPEKSIYQGTWEIKNGEITISLNTQYGRRGIGEPWEKDGHKGYNTYSEFVHEIDEEVKLNWTEISAGLGEDTFAYTVVKKNYICPSVLYTPQLPGQFPFASYKLLSEEDLAGFSAEELSIMQNEIYARYGLKFLRSSVLQYFMDKDWYFPDKSSVDAFLTNIEKRNIRTISAYCRRLNSKGHL